MSKLAASECSCGDRGFEVIAGDGISPGRIAQIAEPARDQILIPLSAVLFFKKQDSTFRIEPGALKQAAFSSSISASKAADSEVFDTS